MRSAPAVPVRSSPSSVPVIVFEGISSPWEGKGRMAVREAYVSSRDNRASSQPGILIVEVETVAHAADGEPAVIGICYDACPTREEAIMKPFATTSRHAAAFLLALGVASVGTMAAAQEGPNLRTMTCANAK